MTGLLLLLVTHFVFGVGGDRQYEVTVDGETIGQEWSSEHGTIVFDTPADWTEVGVVPIPPTDCADLLPVNVMAHPPCDQAREWTVVFGVRNAGPIDAGAFTTRVSWIPPGGGRSTKCNLPTVFLAAGTDVALECRLSGDVPTDPVGDWIILIEVDSGNTVAESDETNNDW